MKRIIVPVDFSPYAEVAFLSAVKLASRGDASITCVNVVNTSLDWENLPEKDKHKNQEILDTEAESKDKLKAFIMDHHTAQTPVEGVVRIGRAATEIIALAHEQAADLIVIGAYGVGFEEGKFIGSTMQKVLRLADCPVLAVKHVLDGRAIKKITFASLFNESSKPAFVKMRPLIKLLDASVHFLYVNTPSQFTDSIKASELMKEYASGQEDLVIHHHIFNHEEAEKGIIAFAENEKSGIIGIASKVKTSSASYQIGVTETVLFKSSVAVLSVKA